MASVTEEDVASLKAQRTKLKQNVTTTAKRLNNAIERTADKLCIERFMIDLETSISDFFVCHDDYCKAVESDETFAEHATVNGMDLQKYATDVESVYKSAKQKYLQSNTKEGTADCNAVKLAVKRVVCQLNRLDGSCTSLNKLLHSEATASEISCVKDEVEGFIDKLMNDHVNLAGVEQTQEVVDLESRVDYAITVADEIKRKATVHLMGIKTGGFTISGDSKQDVISSVSSVHSSIQSTSVSSLNTPITTSNTIHQAFGTGFSSASSPIMSSMSAPSSNLKNDLVSSGATRTPLSYPSTVYSGPSFGGPFSTSYAPGVSAWVPQSYAPSPVGMGVSPDVGNPLGGGAVTGMGVSPDVGNSLGGRAWVSQSFAPSPVGMGVSSDVGNPPGGRAVAGEVYLKKSSLPVFSGSRRDWPEFKAVWKEMAESVYKSQSALAYELKRCLKGRALDIVKNVYVTKAEAYEIMWSRLAQFYDDTSACVQSALDELQKLRSVHEGDYKAMVNLVDTVEATYAQLEELQQLDSLTMRDVDRISVLLPDSVRMVWIRKYYELSEANKLKPMPQFMNFLIAERAAVFRMAEMQKGGSRDRGHTHQSDVNARGAKSGDKGTFKKGRNTLHCAFPSHRNEKCKHNTEACRDFLKLSLDDKFETLKQVHACFNCFGLHRHDRCPSKTKCQHCGRAGHHTLLCRKGPSSGEESPVESSKKSNGAGETSVASYASEKRSTLGLYAIQRAYVVSSGKFANIFCDSGSNVSYITHNAANRLRAKPLDNCTLDMTTVGNVQTTYHTKQYELSIRTHSGKIVNIEAFGMKQITGPASKLNVDKIQQLFPNYDANLLQRQSTYIDVLLGMDYFGLHPKTELNSAGDNLSIMEGELGICLQGSHPDLEEATQLDVNFVRTLHDMSLKCSTHHVISANSHVEFTYPSLQSVLSAKTMSSRVDVECSRFIEGEELATETNPRCGGCKCSKCPTVGHTYSFKEEQELNMIRDGLQYDSENQCWIAAYPWLSDPASLPDNYSSALATLKSTEKTLMKDDNWAQKYKEQMEDMMNRGVARKLTSEEMESWSGPVYYISHLAVRNPKSQSTPVRIVFNSSQVCKGKSLNSVLAKGPDCYMNNLLGLLLRWREESVAAVGDIRKMFNSVHLNPIEQHTHRFLWRDLIESKKPEVYAMVRVNMGDRPAPAICTEAMYKTADIFKDDDPRAAELIRRSSYVDDLIDSFPSVECAVSVTTHAENMLMKGGFRLKCWQFSGEALPRTGKTFGNAESKQVTLLKGNDEVSRVLGVGWKPVEDVLVFEVNLNFSPKAKGVRLGPNLKIADIPHCIPEILTRRIVLEQVMMMFDPLGLLSPFTVLAKVYLRETWAAKLGWDDMIPNLLRQKWLCFFSAMFELEKLQYDRALHPPDAVGLPWLVIFGDGSDIAYGFAAYVRWKLSDGQYWCRLIMAKCRIAPMNKLSTPQMELNAAVLSKRGRKVIEAEMRFKFDKVLHIVDSETVLSMINKVSTRFKVYEGVRIGEIQSATNGDMSSWAWLPGTCNTADWLTRGRMPKDLGTESDWWKGPPVLYEPFSNWQLKYGIQRSEELPGEKKSSLHAANAEIELSLLNVIDVSRFSSINKLVKVIARLIGIFKAKSFRGGSEVRISSDILQDADKRLISAVQHTMTADLKGTKYRSLHPVETEDGLWIVGSRLQRYNPMTPDSEPQILLPSQHNVTSLYMRDSHVSGGHRGRDGTLARFRQRFWTPHGSKLAWSEKNKCQLCKLRDAKFIEQQMGMLPEARLKPSPPFNQIMLDLFGPYKVRGEVQKRTTGKVYGILLTDLVMRAIHIEVAVGYDTNSFLLAFQRFTSIRGWPNVVYSDPGSQLVGAEKELKNAWSDIDRSALVKQGSPNGLKWVFGPADSPWHQGAVESLVKSVKRGIDFAIHNQRLSYSEFLTLCSEVANTINERPIGVLPGSDAEISMLTPNSLLLGRSIAKNPGGWQVHVLNLKHRYHLLQKLIELFWKRWIELGAPGLMIHKKWHTATRNLQPGDIVVIADKNALRGEYRIGLVREVFPGMDGKVRKVKLSYKNFKNGEKLYTGSPDTVIFRSVQNLVLMVPVSDD